MNSVVFAPRALVDFEVAVRWYQRQNPRVAERFRHALSDCVKRIVSAPRMRPQMPDGTRRAHVQRFPYVIVYVEKAGSVQIAAIMHGRRHPDAWTSGFGVRLEGGD